MSDTKSSAVLYNLGKETGPKNHSKSVMTITANGRTLLEKLDVATKLGSSRAFQRRFIIEVKDGIGIALKFQALHGSTFLNGVKLRKVY